MRSLTLFALVPLLALPAAAQPAPDCGPSPAFIGEDRAGLVAEPGFNIFLTLPQSGAVDVPRNAILRLGGFLGDLDGGFMTLFLERESDSSPVPFTRRGAFITPDELLEANTTYRVWSDFTEGGCGPGCGGSINTFTTGTEIDETPPAFTGVPAAHAFIEDVCSFGFGHSFGFFFEELSDDVAWIEAAVLLPDAAPRRALAQAVFFTENASFFASGDQRPLALDEPIRVAFTPFDLAGHVGDAVVVRIRARSVQDLIDNQHDLENLAPRQCDLPSAPTPALDDAAPAGGLVEVDFPFEATPIALSDGEREVALIPVEDTARGQRLLPAEELSPGDWSLVAQPCAFCACAGCALAAEGTFAVDAIDDAAAPEAPRILSVDELLDPGFAQDQCVPDDTAVLVRIAPGVDDGTAPLDLRYHASLRVEGALPLQVGRFLTPEIEGDDHLLRLDTASYGRLLTEELELELVAVDLADNTSTVATHQHGAVAAGCSSTDVNGRGLPLGLFALLGLALVRKKM